MLPVACLTGRLNRVRRYLLPNPYALTKSSGVNDCLERGGAIRCMLVALLLRARRIYDVNMISQIPTYFLSLLPMQSCQKTWDNSYFSGLGTLQSQQSLELLTTESSPSPPPFFPPPPLSFSDRHSCRISFSLSELSLAAFATWSILRRRRCCKEGRIHVALHG